MGRASLPLQVDSYQTLTNDRAVPRENKRRTKTVSIAMARINFLNLTRNFDRLATADAIIADSYLRYILCRSALFALAGTISLANFAAVEISLLWTFQPTLGSITAAALIAASTVSCHFCYSCLQHVLDRVQRSLWRSKCDDPLRKLWNGICLARYSERTPLLPCQAGHRCSGIRSLGAHRCRTCALPREIAEPRRGCG